MDIGNTNSGSIPLPTPRGGAAAGKGASADVIRVAKPDVAVSESVPAPEVAQEDISITPQQAEDARFEAIKQAAQAYVDIYAVSNVKFTIYRGAGGEYITRYTNLQTGEVRQVPEQDLLDLMATQSGGEGVILDTQV
ncbi:MAG: hypothetical protein IT567_00810 [Alphaproteobacteria bacterium]|nr:hypothetical protein [Alphaproteobacteria bacterium]